MSMNLIESQIWSAFDDLRGIVRIEQIFNFITGLLFLKYLDEHPSASSASAIADWKFTLPTKASWRDIAQDASPQRVAEAAHQLTEHSGNQDVSEILIALKLPEIALQIGTSHTFHSLINLVDQISTTGEDFGRAFTVLLDNYLQRLGQRATEFSSTQSLTHLAVQLLAVQPSETVYDPVCGVGRFLVAIKESLEKRHVEPHLVKLYGQEINHEVGALAKLNLLFHEIAPSAICLGDTLTNPCFVNGEELHKFDCVIADPPMNVLLSERNMQLLRDDSFARFSFGLPSRGMNFVFLQHIVASLNNRGRAVVLTSFNPLFADGLEGNIRQRIVQADLIEAVIALPEGLRSGTSVPTVAVILSKNKPESLKNRILFVHAGEEYEIRDGKSHLTLENRERIVQAVHRHEEQRRFSQIVDISIIAENGYNLTPTKYIDILGLTTFLGGKVRWEVLSSLAHVFQGAKIGTPDKKGATPYIRGRDLTMPNLAVSDLETVDAEVISNPIFTEVADVLLQRIGQSPHAAIVPENLKGVLVGETVYIIRLLTETKFLASYLVEFFNSDIGNALLLRVIGGAVVPTVRLKDLRELRIPIPEKTVLDLLTNIQDVEYRFLRRLDQARGLRQRLFSIEDEETASTQLVELNSEAAVLAASLDQSQDLDFQIRNFYPFPLAFAYRTLGAILDPYHRYPEQLRVAENILSFVGSVGLGIAAHHGIPLDSDSSKLTTKLLKDYWQGGISPGDWQALGRATAMTIRGQSVSPFAEQYSSCWFRGHGKKESEFARLTRQMVEMKNDFKHDRGPKTQNDFESASRILEKCLKEVLGHLSFFIQFPIRLVEVVDFEWKSKRAILETLVYAGDHPGLRPETVVMPNGVTKGQLYLEVAPETWLSLYPMISVLFCPSCMTRETYFVDRWDGSSERILLKSFERGHTREGDQDTRRVAADLNYFLQKNLPGRQEASEH